MSGADEITPKMLLYAYASGVFPMAESADSDELLWIDPQQRGIIPLDGFHISRSLRKLLNSNRYHLSIDCCFDEVMRACADRPETWMNEQVFDLYGELHRMSHAHSIEVWQGDELVGGLYGISLAGGFFGESMFSKTDNASKVALAALVARLKFGRYSLLDTQFLTEHLASLGAVEISRADYHAKLAKALNHEGRFFALKADDTYSISQLSTQTS